MLVVSSERIAPDGHLRWPSWRNSKVGRMDRLVRRGRRADGWFGLDVDPSVTAGDGKVRVAGHRVPRDGRTIEEAS